jgi:nucleoside-diphosphate-sugar epimerase
MVDTRQTQNNYPRSVLVTGATGFLGRAFLRAFRPYDSSVFAIVRPERVALLQRGGVSAIGWDLCQELPEFALPETVDAMVHLAAPRNRCNDSLTTMPKHVRLNVDALACLLDWARRHAVKHFVHVSTVSVLQPGNLESGLLSEDGPLARSTGYPYALTKCWAEDIAFLFRGKLPTVTILRPAQVYGAEQDPVASLDEIAVQLRRGETIHVASPDGHVLTPLFISDIIDVLLWTLREQPNETFAVPGPDVVTHRQIVLDLAAQLGITAKIETNDSETALMLGMAPGRLERLYPDRPRTPWLEGVRRTWGLQKALDAQDG